VPSCTYLGGRGQFSHAFSGEVYDLHKSVYTIFSPTQLNFIRIY
jgi:hypothetical protein